MDQDIYVIRKVKIVKRLLVSIVVLGILATLSSIFVSKEFNIFIPLIFLAFPIVVIYWINKKTVGGYKTALTWLTVFFLIFLGGGSKISPNMDFLVIIVYIYTIGVFATSALMVNSIVKSFSPNYKQGDNQYLPSKSKKFWKIAIIVLLGLIIIPAIIGVIISAIS